MLVGNGTAFVQTEPGDGAVAILYDTTSFLQENPQEISTLAQDCNYESCAFPELLAQALGEHYFSASLIPTFDLYKAVPRLIISASKASGVPAPDSADLDWLLLTANPAAGPVQGLAEVYRIDTYTGKPPSSCRKEGRTISVPYAAQYWFYD